jgi:hypothetical protein
MSKLLQALDSIRTSVPANTYPAGMGDTFGNTYYDTLEAGAVTGQNFGLFRLPQSTTKHISKTNMSLGGQFALGTNFIVGRIGLRVTNTDDAVPGPLWVHEVIRFFEATTLAVKLSGKENLGEFPLLEWLGTLNAVAADATPIAIQSGTTSTLWKDISDFPIVLQAQAQFGVNLNVNPAFTLPENMAVKVLLWGVEQRTSV